MRITCGFNLLLMSLMLVTGCVFHKQAKPAETEPIIFHEVLPTPELTNAVEAAVVTNAPGWDVMPNVPQITNAEPVTTAAEPTKPVVQTVPVSPLTPSVHVDGSNAKLIVTPDTTTTATVTWVNVPAKFVVLTFPIGHLPAENQLMTLYRQGLKVGEVKVTGPQKDDNVAADLLSGDAQLGDEVR